MTTSFRTHVRSHEIALRLRRGELVDVLGPGTHWRRLGTVDQVHDRLALRFESRRLEALVQHPALRAELDVVDLADHERALVRRAGRLVALLGPGQHAFWKQDPPLEIERHDVRAVRFEHAEMDRILAHSDAGKFLRAVRTDEHEEILVYHGGRLAERFGPGTYVHWLGAAHVTWKAVDRRERVLDVAGQEIMTSDKVTLRVNLLVTWRVTDPERSVTASDDAAQALYRAAQLVLREAVGTRTLDELLTGKDEVAVQVRGAVTSRAEELGLEVRGVGLRDVILPGDMKSILNQVIEAQKQSEANLIRRREETAAARSQANTAKLLAENPVLLRMKELEQVAQILSGTRATLVLGHGDVSRQLRDIVAESASHGDGAP